MLPDETLQQTVKAYDENGRNQVATAGALGITRSALQGRLARAAQRGLFQRETDRPIPDGFRISGVSTLYSGNGQVVAEWVKTRAERDALALQEALEEVFSQYAHPVLGPPEGPGLAGRLTLYPIADHHLGMFSWNQETGEDYDLSIATKLLNDTMFKLVSAAPPSELGVVLVLGDFFHAETNLNRTPQSGHALDVDTRWAKVLQTGVEALIAAISLALQKHDKVLVRVLPGNHDPYAALTLTVALTAFFRNNPRIEVDASPSPFWVFKWGKVMLSATHGDQVKPGDMPGVMAARWPEVWGSTTWRYAYFGHVHHRSVGGGERHGVVWETFQTLAAKDAWHSANGYSSGRSMVAITIDKDRGEEYRHTVTYQESKR